MIKLIALACFSLSFVSSTPGTYHIISISIDSNNNSFYPSECSHQRKDYGWLHSKHQRIPLDAFSAAIQETLLWRLHHQSILVFDCCPLHCRVCKPLFSKKGWRNMNTISRETLSTLRLRAGSDAHGSGGELRPIAQALVHEDYNVATYDYDIALLKVDEHFEAGTWTIQVAPLPPPDYYPTRGALLNVTGWGFVLVSSRKFI